MQPSTKVRRKNGRNGREGRRMRPYAWRCRECPRRFAYFPEFLTHSAQHIAAEQAIKEFQWS